MVPKLIYSIPFFVAAILIFVVALLAFQRRKIQGSWYLISICVAATIWSRSEGLLYLGHGIDTQLFITYIEYLGISAVSPLSLLFALSIFGFEARIGSKKAIILIAMAIIILMVVWTNPLHQLVYTEHFQINTGPMPMLGLKHGVLWWVILGYHYLLMAFLSFLLIQQFFINKGFRRSQAGMFFGAVAIVWASNAVYASGHSPVPNMDIGPLAFILVALSMSWVLFRYNLLDILPIAKTELFNKISAPIIVLDNKNRILDLNPATEHLFDIDGSKANDKLLQLVLSNHPQLLDIPLIVKLAEQVYRVNDTIQKLMHITRYETRNYLKNQIIDIDKSTK